jgi:hypothetical protein
MTARNSSLTAVPSRLRRAGLVGALFAGVVLLGAYGLSPATFASASPTQANPSTSTIVVNAFGINQSSASLIPAPGTTPGVVSVGDESIINDQLTSTHATNGNYPIVGYDSGTCTYTRVLPDHQALESCIATGVLPFGSITTQGIVASVSGVPEPATFAVTGGTGGFVGAHGTVTISFGSEFETFTIVLQ